jgi:uncharacterized protein VirK/YbjX
VNAIQYYFEKLLGHGFTRRAIYFALFISNAVAIWPLLSGTRGRHLLRLLDFHPEIFHAMVTGFLAANLTVRDRVNRVIDHCKLVEEIGGIVDLQSEALVDLISHSSIDPRYRLTLDQARWFLDEGLLVISLWDGIDRIFSLSFCLASINGRRIAYVGGIQGRAESNVLDRYRRFSKAAYGMRPRDFLVEAFKGFCRALHIVEIHAVSNSNHRSLAWTSANPCSVIKLSYDEIWRERGGVSNGRGFFVVPTTATRRANNEIPAKKREVYRKRYLMLDCIDTELTRIIKFQRNVSNVEPLKRGVRDQTPRTRRRELTSFR